MIKGTVTKFQTYSSGVSDGCLNVVVEDTRQAVQYDKQTVYILSEEELKAFRSEGKEVDQLYAKELAHKYLEIACNDSEI